MFSSEESTSFDGRCYVCSGIKKDAGLTKDLDAIVTISRMNGIVSLSLVPIDSRYRQAPRHAITIYSTPPGLASLSGCAFCVLLLQLQLHRKNDGQLAHEYSCSSDAANMVNTNPSSCATRLQSLLSSSSAKPASCLRPKNGRFDATMYTAKQRDATPLS